jgi:isopenicillin-N epimerase
MGSVIVGPMSESMAGTAGAWLLDPEVAYLNHGAFGSCPQPVLDVQGDFRRRFEREPVRFVEQMLEGLLDEARVSVGDFVGADPGDLVFVANATTGVNTVLRSLPLGKADELIVTDHAYNACRNALDHCAERTGARVAVVRIPFPLRDPEEIVGAVLGLVTPRTRMALIDHISSPTALIFPVQRLVRELSARGVETLIDGAHAPGQIPLDLRALGATYYAANFHKWCCAPKGAGMLYVRRDRQKMIRPLVISHGANSQRTDRARFLVEFDWTGTVDMSAFLSIPYALRYLDGLVPGGFSATHSQRSPGHRRAVPGKHGGFDGRSAASRREQRRSRVAAYGAAERLAHRSAGLPVARRTKAARARVGSDLQPPRAIRTTRRGPHQRARSGTRRRVVVLRALRGRFGDEFACGSS